MRSPVEHHRQVRFEVVNGALSATIDERAVKRGELIISAADYGAFPSTTVDQSPALNSAAAAALAAGANAQLLIPRGNYPVNSTVVVRCALEATEATLTYYGTGTALLLGSDQAGVVTARQSFRAPRVIKAERVSGWDGTSSGIQANNLSACKVWVPFVQDSENGLVVSGMGSGTACTRIVLGALWDNHKNLVRTNDATGRVNQNTFVDGQLNQTMPKGAVLDAVNAKQISMVSTTSFGGPIGNTFIETSIEGVNVSYYRVDIDGKYNFFVNCRWENFTTPFRIRYREGAEWNKIDGGYNASQIIEVFDEGVGRWGAEDCVGLYLRSFNTAGQSIENNLWTTVDSWNTPTLIGVTYDAALGEFTPRPGRWLISATVAFARNVTG